MDKKLITLMAMFFIAFGTFMIMTVFSKQISVFTRASGTLQASSQNSLIFAWPLATTVSKPVSVNVFIRSTNNLPLQDKKVKLVTNLGSVNGSSNQATSTTDSSGKAAFILTSDTQGVADLKAWIDDSIQISQKISVKFE